MTKAANHLHCEPLAVRSPQAALLLGISEKTLIEWNKSDNPPPHIRRGGCVLYPVAELRQWLASQIDSKPDETIDDLNEQIESYVDELLNKKRISDP